MKVLPMDQSADSRQNFQSPMAYVVLFYLLLLAWTVGTLPVVYMKFRTVGFQSVWIYASMIGFVYAYTLFWSLGIFYRISVDEEGIVVLKSLRRELTVSAKQIASIEGSRFPGGFGFVKLKVPRETGYLFCLRQTGELDAVLQGIRKKNTLTMAVRI
ncbi:MAG: hypothetical protein NTW71_12215 [Deltaproteobacteria bacterium]|nr:hypothetical protein [Deltaproteobacteria bacterium]